MKRRKTSTFSDALRAKECQDQRWKEIRQKVLERDGFKSVQSKKPAEHVHHLAYLMHDDGTEYHYWEYADHLDLLVSLTAKEHCKLHGIIYEHHFDNDYKTIDEPATTIYKTNDYDKFAFLDYNRGIDHPERIVRQMKKYGAVPCCIYVFCYADRLWILDGQNTFTARKNNNQPIYYAVIKIEDEDEAREIVYTINTAIKGWTNMDRIKSYESNSEEYAKLVGLIVKYDFIKPVQVWGVLSTLNWNGHPDGVFGSPDFKFTDYNLTLKIIEGLKALNDAGCQIKYWNDKAFVSSLIQWVKTELIELDRFVDKFVKAVNKDSKLVNTKWKGAIQYKNMIREVYNYQAGRNQRVDIPID